MTTDLASMNDQAKADAYASAARSIRTDASTYGFLADFVEPRESLLTFGEAYVDGLRRHYGQLRDYCAMVADQADEVARHYQAAANGTDMSVSA